MLSFASVTRVVLSIPYLPLTITFDVLPEKKKFVKIGEVKKLNYWVDYTA